MKNKDILVIGGLGFIGHHLVAKLLDDGARVTVVDNLSGFQDTAYDSILLQERLRTIRHAKIDLRSFEEFMKGNVGPSGDSTKKWSVVYYLGGVSSQRDATEGFASHTRDGIETAFLLDMLAYQVEGSIFFASTSMVYGSFEEGVEETAVPKPISDYGRSRFVTEETLRKLFAKRKDVRLITFRFSAVYGLRDNSRRVLGKMLFDAMYKNTVKVNTTTGQMDFTYVNDLVESLRIAPDKVSTEVNKRSFPNGSVINLTTGRPQMTLEDVAKHVVGITGPGTVLGTYQDSSYPTRNILSNEARLRFFEHGSTFRSDIGDKLQNVLVDIQTRLQRTGQC